MSRRSLPAEWAPQGAVMLIWPHDRTDWAGSLDRAEAAMAALALAITRFESLVVVCRDAGVRRNALDRLVGVGCNRAAVATVIADTDDTWARDIAPIPVADGELPLLVHCRFNGWGGKYDHAKDREFGRTLIDAPGFATLGYERAPITLEGGALDSDGAGSLLVNLPTVVDPDRNPDLDAAAAEARFRQHFGIERTLWIDVPALPGDHTDGHIDTLARFCDPATIAYTAAGAAEPAAAATTHAALEQQLPALRSVDGSPYRLIPLPEPAPITAADGTPLAASYTNFLLVNGAVLVPAYADPADATAIERLHAAFPERTVVPVPARTFVEQGGAVHCLTMQLPAGIFEDLALS
ncbi:agmatine deiminase family protein [Halofilum ochraceum]|uniref:agmatine deiminase family protein n=1 Tax=Halofilum ochraceum TaxID=1611323 RepID=UPI0008DAED7A|nr:agmatine deiminase family protein [Halofilum ochraceum]